MTRSTGNTQPDLAARCWPGIAARTVRADIAPRLIPALVLLAVALAMAPLTAAQPSRPDGDGDGLVDADETGIYGTDPRAADTDGDGSSDREEVSLGTDPLTSNAVQPSDRDGDGLFDDEEVNVYGTSPDNPDTDEDGRPDGPEVAEGTDPLVKTITTLTIRGDPGPAPVDSDGDGLDDGAEATYGTDPARIDSDDDGLKDGEEVHVFGTSPTTWDTDGNSYSDWEDAARAAHPPVPPQQALDTGEPEAEEGVDPETGDGEGQGDEWGADLCHPPDGHPNDFCMEEGEQPDN